MKAPAIKGSVMVNLVEDVLRLRAEGRVTEEELGARLEPRDLEVLEEKILPTWYPIDTYQRLTELVLEKEGGGEDYLRERGAGSAKRLLEAGLYEQMRRLRPADQEITMAEVERSVRALVTMSQTILNFGRGEVLRDPQHEKRMIIQISDAAAYPEVLRFTSEGFYNACARAAGRRFRWRSSRPAPDRILMHMDADFDA